MECKQERNLQDCKCTYSSCPRRGLCCECIRHHLENRELPGCCFPAEAEKSYDRSFERFVKCIQEGKI
ncbi:MAG: DUF6485 family protein [Candidatus Woesearchaeota archaeon]